MVTSVPDSSAASSPKVYARSELSGWKSSTGVAGSPPASNSSLESGIRWRRLDVEVADLVVVALDERLAGGNFFAHKLGEDAVCGHGIFDVHLQHGANPWVHRRLPELAGV